MQQIHPPSTRILRQSNEQTACSDMNQVAWLDSQGPLILQMLPEDEAERKLLISWVIDKHNTSCSVPTNKIATVKPSFSSSYPKLATWIKNTFSDLSADGMHLIAFALARFPQYHNLVTSRDTMPPKANTQIIEDWFQHYGTKLCSKALTDLSYLMKETGEFEFFKHDISKFCSRVTPAAINSAAFEPVSGIHSLNRDTAKCFYASSAVFARLYLSENSTIRFISQSIMPFFGLSLDESYTTKARFPDPFQAIMATIDDFIRSKAPQPDLLCNLLTKRINKWSEYNNHEGIDGFRKAIGIIDEMQTNEAERASLQTTALKPKEHTGSSSMAGKTPASSKPGEEVDTYELC